MRNKHVAREGQLHTTLLQYQILYIVTQSSNNGEKRKALGEEDNPTYFPVIMIFAISKAE